jgi:hypothetical protein
MKYKKDEIELARGAERHPDLRYSKLSKLPGKNRAH